VPTRRATRTSALLATLSVAGSACAPTGAPAREPALEERIDTALQRAGAFLRAAQDDDGAWRSGVYGNLRAGAALTATVTKALLFSPAAGSEQAAAAGVDWLVAAAPGGEGAAPLGYPVYTSALAVMALSQPAALTRPGAAAARDAWLELLLDHQLDEDLGWTPADPAHGGWGYSLAPPRRPAAGTDGETRGARPAFDADLSSTVFALGALSLVGRGPDDPAVSNARGFVERCQNFGRGDPRFDDGGFCFTPTAEHQNKAGVAGVDAAGRVRYHSYGAMTADGVRALLRCGLAPDHPRVVAAADWLREHFEAASHPGRYEPAREVERESSYYYWCWSAAHAFRALGLHGWEGPDGPLDWTEALASELLRSQRPDGSWTNGFKLVKEDDPLVATPLAAAALGLCRLQRALGDAPPRRGR
jgi:squalene-hopene/tetraprenyl-beta-curcumene cyclase